VSLPGDDLAEEDFDAYLGQAAAKKTIKAKNNKITKNQQ